MLHTHKTSCKTRHNLKNPILISSVFQFRIIREHFFFWLGKGDVIYGCLCLKLHQLNLIRPLKQSFQEQKFLFLPVVVILFKYSWNLNKQINRVVYRYFFLICLCKAKRSYFFQLNELAFQNTLALFHCVVFTCIIVHLTVKLYRAHRYKS